MCVLNLCLENILRKFFRVSSLHSLGLKPSKDSVGYHRNFIFLTDHTVTKKNELHAFHFISFVRSFRFVSFLFVLTSPHYIHLPSLFCFLCSHRSFDTFLFLFRPLSIFFRLFCILVVLSFSVIVYIVP